VSFIYYLLRAIFAQAESRLFNLDNISGYAIMHVGQLKKEKTKRLSKGIARNN
jgi:hypothetical protein